MAKVIVKIYVHRDKESNYDVGEKLGFSEKVMQKFKYCCSEVELEVKVDTETGDYDIISVNGAKLAKKRT